MKMNRFITRMLSILLALILLASAALAEDQSNSDLTGYIVILHTNDSHGRADTNLGFSRVAYAKKRLEEAGATVLLLDAGDTLHGLPFATASEGESVVKVMNAVGYDAMTPGNHDFNYGWERLIELAETADFPIISANVKKENGDNLLPGSAIIEKGYAKFGVFGLTSPETAYKTNPNNIFGLTFSDPIQAAQEQTAALEEAGCTLIIALSHIGMEEGADVASTDVAEQVEGIDIIIDGHSHTVLEEGQWVDDTLIASAGEYIEYIGCIIIDPEGRAEAGLLTEEDLNEYAEDAEVKRLIDEITASQDELLNVAVGQSSVALEGAREKVRTEETNLGNLAADAFRSETGADVALINGGGVRDSIPAGEMTKKQLVTVFPFGNYVVTLNITGEQLIEVLENGVSCYPDADGRFPQVSGVSFKFDPDQEVGSRVFDVSIDGEPVEPEKTYLLATNDYIAAGGDEYPLADVPVAGEFSAMEEILIDYIASQNGSIAPETEGRILMEAKPAQ